MALPTGGPPPSRLELLRTEASALARDEPELVAAATATCRAAAERDLVDGIPRGKAIVRRLRDLAVDRPALAVAVGRSLGLEHIVDDLLGGTSVDGVAGIGADGRVLPPSRADRRRRRGTVILLIGGLVLLAGATVADSLSLFLVVGWTVVSFVLIFGGLRDVLHRG